MTKSNNDPHWAATYPAEDHYIEILRAARDCGVTKICAVSSLYPRTRPGPFNPLMIWADPFERLRAFMQRNIDVAYVPSVYEWPPPEWLGQVWRDDFGWARGGDQ